MISRLFKKKKLMSFMMAMVLMLTAFLPQLTNIVESKAALVTGFNNDAMPAEADLLRWDFSKDYSYGSSYIETNGMYKNAEACNAINKINGKTVATANTSYITRLKGITYNPYVKYKEIGTIVLNGVTTKVDLKVSITGFQLEDAFGVGGEAVEFTSGVGIQMWGCRWIDVKYEFFKSGTNTPIAVNGIFTQVDLDLSQYFAFPASSGVTHLSRDPNHRKINSDKLDHISISTTKINGEDYAKVQSSKAMITNYDGEEYVKQYDFAYYPEKILMDDAEESGYVSAKFNSSVVKFRFGVSDQNMYERMNNHVFNIIPHSISSYKAPVPNKFVIDDTALDGSIKPATSVKKLDGDKKVKYVIDVYVPRSLKNNYNFFMISDDLPDELGSAKNVTYTIYKDSTLASNGTVGNGEDVTGWFEKNNSSYPTTDDVLNLVSKKTSDINSFFGCSYQVLIEAEIDKDVLTKKGWTTSKGYNHSFTNKATCTAGVWDSSLNDGTGGYKKETKESNTVTVEYNEPVLDVIKNVRNVTRNGAWTNHFEDDSDVEAEYVVYITNTNKNATVRGLVYQDYLPSGFTVDSVTAVIDGVTYTPQKASGVALYDMSVGDKFISGAVPFRRFGSGTLTYTGSKTSSDDTRVVTGVSGDYIKIVANGVVGKEGSLNTASAWHTYTTDKVSESASIDSDGVYVPRIAVTKEMEDDYWVTGETKDVVVTVEHHKKNDREDVPVEIWEIEDTITAWANDYFDGTSKKGYFESQYVTIVGAEPQLYKVAVDGTKTLLDVGEEVWEADKYWSVPETGFISTVHGASNISLDVYMSDYEESYIELAYGEKLEIHYQVRANNLPTGYFSNGQSKNEFQWTWDIPIVNEVIVTDGYGNGVKDTDRARVYQSDLGISKRADKEKYDYGETAHYTVNLRQYEDYVTSSVVYADYFMDDIFATSDLWASGISDTWYEDIVESVKITDKDGNDVTDQFYVGFHTRNDPVLPYSVRSEATAPVLFITFAGEDYYPFALRRDNYYTIEYDVSFDEQVFKDYTDNVVEANNRAMLIPMDVSTYETDGVQTDDEKVEVYVPEVFVEKRVVQYSDLDATVEELFKLDFEDEITVEAGQVVWYRVDASFNSESGTVNRFSIDDYLPENLDLIEDSWKIVTSDYTDLSDLTSFWDYTNGGAFIFSSTSIDEVTVFFAAKVKTGTEGTTNVNTATVSASNAQEKSDTATVNVRPRPVLSIDKYSDKTNYTLGETGHYTIEVTNTVENSIARDIQVFDVIEDSVTVKENTIKATLIKSGATTGESWVVQPDTYSGTVLSVGRDGICIDFYIGGDTGSAERPNLEYGDKLVVEYDVVYNEAGDVVNDAEAYSSNADYVSTTNTVTVTDPSAELTIDKYAHKNSFVVGESPYYTLEISQVKEDAVAENITIVDYFDVWVDIEN